jgi:beta-galactosidase
VHGRLDTALAPGLALITERKLDRGAVVLLGAMPEGGVGRELLAALIDHCATRAGISPSPRATPGTLVCPRIRSSGRRAWIAVNLDGAGGTVDLPANAGHAIDGGKLPPGPRGLPPFGWLAFEEA